jgi:hypothetical protein
MAVDKQLTFRIDKIEGLKTTKYPFYQKCVRFRFNLSRNQGTDLSPVCKKNRGNSAGDLMGKEIEIQTKGEMKSLITARLKLTLNLRQKN